MKSLTNNTLWIKLGLLLAAIASTSTQAADREDVIAGVIVGAAAGYMLSEHGGGVQIDYNTYRRTHYGPHDYHHNHHHYDRHYHGKRHAYYQGNYRHGPKYRQGHFNDWKGHVGQHHGKHRDPWADRRHSDKFDRKHHGEDRQRH